jgi:hypothetical protein
VLSYLYRIAREFERCHGVTPNLLYLSYGHFEKLSQALSGLRQTGTLIGALDMQIILQRDVAHPRVGWSPARAREGAAAARPLSIHNGIGLGQERIDPL